MESLEQIKTRLEAAFPAARLEILTNPAVAAQSSLLVEGAQARKLAEFLRDDSACRLDFCSNVTGVDWPDRVEKIKSKVKKLVDGVEQELEEVTERTIPGFLEVVYHLYSMSQKEGPVILRQRTGNRSNACVVASLTPVWRACEFQEREVFDLFGVVFEGHPDLRRILMWDEFRDFPMRKDYVEPDDYEYEPTPHADVLEKSQKHVAATPG